MQQNLAMLAYTESVKLYATAERRHAPLMVIHLIPDETSWGAWRD